MGNTMSQLSSRFRCRIPGRGRGHAGEDPFVGGWKTWNLGCFRYFPASSWTILDGSIQQGAGGGAWCITNSRHVEPFVSIPFAWQQRWKSGWSQALSKVPSLVRCNRDSGLPMIHRRFAERKGVEFKLTRHHQPLKNHFGHHYIIISQPPMNQQLSTD